MPLMSFLRKFAVAPLPVSASWYAAPLRLIVGLGFLEHGYAKLSRGADGFIGILHATRYGPTSGACIIRHGKIRVWNSAGGNGQA
jgi:hypothetical protein